MDATQTHRDLIERCREGRRDAQFELYRIYSQTMYNTALRIVQQHPDADDVLQSTFLHVYTKISSYRYESSFDAWIRRITINMSINFLRSRRSRWAELTPNLDRFDEPEPDFESEDESSAAYTVENINKAIAELPDGCRVVFSLYALEGYDHEEIAQILGITKITSRTQYSRAKIKLREKLRGLEGRPMKKTD